MIFISTGGAHGIAAIEVARGLCGHGINSVELSGGKHSPSQVSELIKSKDKFIFQVHNYFPPPQIPFVFNLASFDSEILHKSIEHARFAMALAAKLDRPIYSFHAGFRLNPLVSELGAPLGHRKLVSREAALEQFGNVICNLAEEARLQGIRLLIENNVLSSVNVTTYGEDPFLLTEPNEILSFFDNVPNNVGFLLDVAHLKVSGNSLGFNYLEAHELLNPLIEAYHLSDNDGLSDSNGPISEDSWFWHGIKKGLDYYSLEIYKMTYAELYLQYKLAREKIEGSC